MCFTFNTRMQKRMLHLWPHLCEELSEIFPRA